MVDEYLEFLPEHLDCSVVQIPLWSMNTHQGIPGTESIVAFRFLYGR